LLFVFLSRLKWHSGDLKVRRIASEVFEEMDSGLLRANSGIHKPVEQFAEEFPPSASLNGRIAPVVAKGHDRRVAGAIAK